MRKIHSIHEAKTHLSRLVERACAGEEIVIARGKVEVSSDARVDQRYLFHDYGRVNAVPGGVEFSLEVENPIGSLPRIRTHINFLFAV